MSADVIISVVLLIVSLAFLVKASDIFTNASERVGLYFGLSSFIVGATIVSIGSSLPELATSLISIISGDAEQAKFAIDNIIGSNIANIFLVAGISAIAVGTLKVKEKLIDVDLPFFFMSSALFILLIMDRKFTWQEGIISLVLLVIFIIYIIKNGKEIKKEEKIKKPKIKIGLKEIGGIIIGAGGIFLAAKYTVVNVLDISAKIPGIDQTLVTMLVVAVGTSLPELVVSVRAAIRGKHSIALGNVLGSNTFNVLAVAGLPSFFGTLKVSDGAFYIGIPFLIVATLSFIFTTQDNTIKKWEGYALIVMYLVFVGKLIGVL